MTLTIVFGPVQKSVEQVVVISDVVCMGIEEIIEFLRKKCNRVSEVMGQQGRRI